MRRIARAALSRARTSTSSARVDATATNARGVQWRAKDWSTQDLDDDAGAAAPEKPPAFEKPKPKRAVRASAPPGHEARATSAGSPSRALRSHRTALPHRPSRDANAAMSSAVSAAAVAPAVLEASCSRARFLPDASGPAIARHEATRAATRTSRAVSLRVAPGSLVEESPAANERLGVVESSSRERVVPSCLIHQVSASH